MDAQGSAGAGQGKDQEAAAVRETCALFSAIGYLVGTGLYGDALSALQVEIKQMKSKIAGPGQPLKVSIDSLALPRIKKPKLFDKPAAEAIDSLINMLLRLSRLRRKRA